MIVIRRAGPGDAALALRFIRELAAYERLEGEMVADEAAVRDLLFSDPPGAFCEFAELDGEAAGFALWFYNASTFEGRRGLYLEDIFVRPEHRGEGVGLALMRALARRCADEGLRRMEWAVLNWNAPARRFYDALGAEAMDGWTTRRLSGAALAKLAQER
ncbi:MAG TPA: GNAT family N-acetyltransferase [Caulobacteraceae bacterium]|nr:GNAT family N-acetyltransferase [Caulobacteraceae bacterium]